jgi:hypothetical protein
MTRRLAAMLAARLNEAHFDEVCDGRNPRGKRWEIRTLLTAVTVAMAAGAKSLAEAERVTATMPRAARRWLGIDRRVPDTTLRDALGRVRPQDLVSRLHSVVLAAHRRKALPSSRWTARPLASPGATTSMRNGRRRTSKAPW